MSILNSSYSFTRVDSVEEHQSAFSFFRNSNSSSVDCRNICSLLKSAVFLCMEAFIVAKMSRTSERNMILAIPVKLDRRVLKPNAFASPVVS